MEVAGPGHDIDARRTGRRGGIGQVTIVRRSRQLTAAATTARVSLRCVELIGRAEETARLHALIADASAGRGGALILRGEPGIGKTALLRRGRPFARDSSVRVLQTVGLESEMHLPYAGLHQLLRPVRESLGALPPSQREALRAALGLTETAAPEVYLVALAALNLLAEVAETAPVLLLAEDAHWLDPSTGDVLAFLGRRLESEPIALLAVGPAPARPPGSTGRRCRT